MGIIDTPYSITPYYIDFALKKNKVMKAKTIAYNKEYWFKSMNVNERINIKSWYLFEGGKLFEKLHLINTSFFGVPNIVNAQL